MPERRKRRKSSRNAELSTVTGIGGGRGRETQNCRHFWTRLGSSRLKSVNSHRDRGVLVAKPGSVVTVGLASGLRVSKVSTVTGIGGVGVAKPRTVVTSQKCQQSQGSGGVLVPKLRTVVTVGLVSGLRVSKVSTVTGIGGGPGRETQNCRHCWTRLGSSRLKSVNSHRDRGVLVAKPRSVVTFRLASGLRVSKVSTVTGIGGVLVAKPRSVVTFGLVSGERKGDGREEKREIRGENRGERREEKRRVDRRKERGERREERGEKRRESGERRERGEERG